MNPNGNFFSKRLKQSTAFLKNRLHRCAVAGCLSQSVNASIRLNLSCTEFHKHIWIQWFHYRIERSESNWWFTMTRLAAVNPTSPCLHGDFTRIQKVQSSQYKGSLILQQSFGWDQSIWESSVRYGLILPTVQLYLPATRICSGSLFKYKHSNYPQRINAPRVSRKHTSKHLCRAQNRPPCRKNKC